MSTLSPPELVETLTALGAKKARLPAGTMLLRGMYSGLLLGLATTLSLKVAEQTGLAVWGALAFPVGFVMILLLGMELVTGNFAVIPMAWWDGRTDKVSMFRNWLWVLLGNLAGCLVYGAIFALYITQCGQVEPPPMVDRLIAVAESKTLAYQTQGSAGLFTVWLKAVICNWMVSMGVVMAFVSRSTSGKILAMWLPIFTFFTLGLEHCVVNMFVIPAAMMLRADIGFDQWLLWNQIPAIFGNALGGMFLTGWFLRHTHGRSAVAD